MRPLQRLYLNLAKFDDAAFVGHALTVLERDAPRGEFVGRRVIDGLLVVEHHRERVAPRRDLVNVPLAGGMRHGIDRGNVDDRAGAIFLHRASIPDVHLIGGLAAD